MPSGAERHQQAGEEAGRRDAEEPERVRPRRVAAAVARRQQLAQVGIDQRQLRADADAREEPRRRSSIGALTLNAPSSVNAE